MNPDQARVLFDELGAPAHLVRHAELVREAAQLLIDLHDSLRIPVDGSLIEVGALLHDVGKVLHPEELHRPGHAHEEAGYALLKERGVLEPFARHCLTHARWAEMDCSLEELTVALADKLWKGKRVEALERLAVEAAATRAGRGFWDVFVALDTGFEQVAREGDERLARSRGVSVS